MVGGWGQGSQPDKDILAPLISMNPRIVWKAIALDRLDQQFFGGRALWKDRVALVQSDPERIARRLAAIDEELLKARTRKLVLFDALDRVADPWPDRQKLLKGLFELLLEFRYTRSIRLKAFVRADAVEDPEIRAFPDASKLLHARVELTWPKVDLYGLFWQHLGNARKGGSSARFRSRVGEGQRPWELPEKLARDKETQKELFTKLAGEKMGGGLKRGRPYLWIPNHPAGCPGPDHPAHFSGPRCEPRRSRPPKTATEPRTGKAIEKGVVKASEIRVDEPKEDFA